MHVCVCAAAGNSTLNAFVIIPNEHAIPDGSPVWRLNVCRRDAQDHTRMTHEVLRTKATQPSIVSCAAFCRRSFRRADAIADSSR